MRFLLFCLLLTACLAARAQSVKNVTYPYPVRYLNLQREGVSFRMAYMDVPAAATARRTVVLLHGKNFNGYYWKDIIPVLTQSGCRVIVPDLPGWGLSDHPNLHYSFPMLAGCVAELLDTLRIAQAGIVGHSMGGMVATRFALQYPLKTSRLLLEDPIGLEDYKTFVPYHSLDAQVRDERSQTYESIKKYQQSYYPQWKPEYEELVQVQASALQLRDYADIAFVNAVIYEMIYNEPVCYEFGNLGVPVLLVIGEADRTIVGKNLLSEAERAGHGDYPELAKRAAEQIGGANILLLPGVGHIPHIQSPDQFVKPLVEFFQ